MGSALLVTGPPGAGKSSVAAWLVDAFDRSALVTGDSFFAFLRRGAVQPWLSEARAQNETVTRAAGAATGALVAGGYDVVYDGVVGPWFLDEFMAGAGLTTLRYVVLLPTVEVCVRRVAERTGHGFGDEAATRHMHEQFAAAAIEPRHVIDASAAGVEEIGAEILHRADDGLLTMPRRGRPG